MVVPAVMTHICIGSPYAWSLMADVITRDAGFVASAASDWGLGEAALPLSIVLGTFGLSATLFGKWQLKVGPRKSMAYASVAFGSGSSGAVEALTIMGGVYFATMLASSMVIRAPHPSYAPPIAAAAHAPGAGAAKEVTKPAQVRIYVLGMSGAEAASVGRMSVTLLAAGLLSSCSPLVTPAQFEAAFGTSVERAADLIATKTLTINKLLVLAPPGTLDPTPHLYDSTMYTLGTDSFFLTSNVI
ncbi:unnamed protein product [Sphagnum balticum]